MANKANKENLNLDGMSDVDLKKKAVGLGITVTEDMKREDIEKAVVDAVIAKSKQNEDDKEEMKEKGMVCVQYKSKGTTKIDNKVWRGTMKGIVTKEYALLLKTKFPKRFEIIE
jgi:hypothetical protein